LERVKENILVVYVSVLAIRQAAVSNCMIQEYGKCLLVWVWLSDFNSQDNSIEKTEHCGS
jgi:hypothetical protein